MAGLEEDLAHPKNHEREVHKAVVKLKFADFSKTTIERAATGVDRSLYRELLQEAWLRGEGKSVRLIGAGVRFRVSAKGGAENAGKQMKLF